MPGVQSCRQRYQWYKHGSCSDMKPQVYFDRAINYVQWFNDSIVAKYLKNHLNKEVSLQELLSFIDKMGASKAVSFHCREKNGKPVLVDLRFYLDNSLSDPAITDAFFKGNYINRCPDVFFIDI